MPRKKAAEDKRSKKAVATAKSPDSTMKDRDSNTAELVAALVEDNSPQPMDQEQNEVDNDVATPQVIQSVSTTVETGRVQGSQSLVDTHPAKQKKSSTRTPTVSDIISDSITQLAVDHWAQRLEVNAICCFISDFFLLTVNGYDYHCVCKFSSNRNTQ